MTTAYRRNGKLVCIPCSDSEDREKPVHVHDYAKCSICGERVDGR